MLSMEKAGVFIEEDSKGNLYGYVNLYPLRGTPQNEMFKATHPWYWEFHSDKDFDTIIKIIVEELNKIDR
jgi:hypothetical protein